MAPWIDELLAKLHAIYGQKWANHVSGIPYEALRATWGEALAGWAKKDAKAALDHCAKAMPWPPALPDFIGAMRAEMNGEQRALAARLANAERQALPSRTWAERKAEGRAQAQQLRQMLAEAETREALAKAAMAQDEDEEPPEPEQIAALEQRKRAALAALARMQAERG